MTQGIYQIASTLSSIVIDVCDVHVTRFTDPVTAQQKQDVLIKQWSDFTDALWQKAKNTQVRDYFRFGAAFITESVLMGKCAKAISECVLANKNHLLRKISQPRSVAFVTAEGAPVYVGAEASEIAFAEKMAADKVHSGVKKIKGKKNKKVKGTLQQHAGEQFAVSTKMYTYAHGVYEDAPYHLKRSIKKLNKDVSKKCKKKSNLKKGKGHKSYAPLDGQVALDKSVAIKGNTERRVSVNNKEIVILDKTFNRICSGKKNLYIMDM